MSDVNSHVDLELQDLLDDRLPEPRRAAVAGHAAACARCRNELEALKRARDAVRGLPNVSPPPDLRARVIAGLDAVDNEVSRRPAARVAWRSTRTVASAVLLAAAAVAFFLVRRPQPIVAPTQIAADYTGYKSGSLALEVRVSEPAAVETHFRNRGVTFATRVFDLSMMGYLVLGGAVRGTQSRERAFFVYRGADGSEITCQMYVGRVSDLPPALEVRRHKGIEFHIHKVGTLTLVFWQEGDVICVLTSNAKPEAVIDLAIAKAVKA